MCRSLPPWDCPAAAGIDGSTGRYLSSVRGTRYTAPPTDLAAKREYEWWVGRYGLDDPNRQSVFSVNPKSLASAGWAVVYAPDIGPEIQEALAPLLRRRREQAGAYFKTYSYQKGQTKRGFLQGKAGEGPANPKKVPYYVLLVGDPRTMPFSFQYELDVQYAVGRIHFEKPEDYAHYAASVVAGETRPESPRPRQVTLFGARNPDDRATFRTATQLVEPLAAALGESESCKWPVRPLVGEPADKAQLARVLGGPETPALLFTATHGMAYPDQPEEMLRTQGALLCQDWPGPRKWEEGKAIQRDFYFAAEDVSPEANLLGLIAFHFACYSAGTPDLSDFEAPILGRRQPIASYPFLSRLAQRLLSHPRGGALAVLGHIDRAWTTSFRSKDDPDEKGGQIEAFQSTLETLLDGFPVGCASEYLNQKHAELAVEINKLFADREYLVGGSAEEFESRWRATNDMRNFVVLGDPAVRLCGV